VRSWTSPSSGFKTWRASWDFSMNADNRSRGLKQSLQEMNPILPNQT
jgi:hypothetical protein